MNKSNLVPFSGKDDPRRQNGRKKGSKNLSTIVKELLEGNMSLTEPINKEMKDYFSNSPTTYKTAIVKAMIIKAINGDVRAANWVLECENRAEVNASAENSFFNKPEIIFQVIPDRQTKERQKNLE